MTENEAVESSTGETIAPEAAKTQPAPPTPASPTKAAKKVAPAKKAAKKTAPTPAKKSSTSAKAAAKKSAPKKSASAKKSKSPATAGPTKQKEKGKLKSVKSEAATILDSQVAFEGPLFRVLRDHIIEPGGRESHRDVIRHNGSVVILATDPGKRKKDPWIVVERQYRHAAGQFLWELPAGKLDAGETAMEGAKRELAEETGYQASKWSPLIEYYASPGFLGEAMKVFLAEGLIAGEATPEEDEQIDFRLVKLSEMLEMIDKGRIIDGKTLTTILLYARKLGLKRKK